MKLLFCNHCTISLLLSRVFTAQEVAGRFLPHQTHTMGRKERIAATHALQHLADTGVHGLRQVHGEVWYLND